MTPFTIATSGPLTPMVEFRKVPQLMAEGDDLELVATALPGTAVAAGRRFSTLALARLCGATNWASAAEALDLVSRPEGIAGRMTTFVTDPQQLWRGIVGLAERLRQRGPADYRARRQAPASWAGLTPRHRESDTVVRRGPITKQGSTLVRWAAVEAAHGAGHAGRLSEKRSAIAGRRGRNIATVAVACKLLTLVYYGPRDGHIRALAQTWAAG